MKRIIILLALFISGKTMAQPAVKNGELQLTGAVVFKTGSDQFAPNGDTVLNQVKNFLDEKSYISTLRVEGHMGTSASEATAQTLSEKRALAICKWLVAKGIDCKRLIAVGFGSTKPVAGNDTPEGRAQNTRTAFVLAGLRNRPIGGMPLDGGGKVAGQLCE